MKANQLLGLMAVVAVLNPSASLVGVSLETAPPVVVRTQPLSGSTNVDPRTSEIVVQFSKPMQDGSWSWSTWGEENFPELTGQPHYAPDGKTCILPVKLEPGKFYTTWLNSEKFGNFKDRDGRSAVPYLLTFTTAPGSASRAAEGGEQSGVKAWVERFFDKNYRDITSRETLDWGEPELDPEGNVSVRYRYRARIWDRETVTNNQVFKFDSTGKFIETTKLPVAEIGNAGRKFMRVVVDDGRMTFEGRETSWEKLDEMLAAVPNRANTVLEWAVPTDQITIQQQNNWTSRFAQLAQKYGFEYPSYVGVHPFGSIGAESMVREVAARFARAIQQRDDEQLKAMSTDAVVAGWVKAVTHFGDELRVKLNESGAGFEPLGNIEEVILKGNLAAVKTAHLKDKGMYLALFFCRTGEGWRNCCLQNSPASKTLAQNFNEFADREDAFEKAGAASGGQTDQVSTLLNDDQKAVIEWTDRQFRSYWDERTFDGWSAEEIENLEKRMIDALDGPRSRDYYTAINTLGALGSAKALPRLRELAFERVDKNNRDRWMAVRVLGLMGDRESIPNLIHLVYHGNQNTHWWAQITLVRLTGQNFGSDWQAWGKWWNETGGQPPYNPQIIRWWDGQAADDELAQSLAESNRKFLQDIRAR